MTALEFAGDAEFDPADRNDAPSAPPLRFREPDPHERVPGDHVAYSAETQWCRACTDHYVRHEALSFSNGGEMTPSSSLSQQGG
jgi:hypothetical protein